MGFSLDRIDPGDYLANGSDIAMGAFDEPTNVLGGCRQLLPPAPPADVGPQPGMDALSRSQRLGSQSSHNDSGAVEREGLQLEGQAGRRGPLLTRTLGGANICDRRR